MLDQHYGRAAALGNHVGEVPDLRVAEEMAVLHFLRARFRRSKRLLLAAGADADERTDDRTEIHRLVLRKVAPLHDLELAALRL